MDICEFLKALAGASPASAGGLASMTSGAAGAALYVKCRYQKAQGVLEDLHELSTGDGQAFREYLEARRGGGEFQSSLRKATESPLAASELCLNLVSAFPLAKATCPRSMVADLLVGRTLLLGSAQSGLFLARANLDLFPQPWVEGERRFKDLLLRLERHLDSDRYRALFARIQTVAVVGISNDAEKPAYYVPEYLQQQGYRVLGIHPQRRSVLASRTFPSLQAVDEPVDMVIFFRRSEFLMSHLDDLLAMQPAPGTVWLQQGIHNDRFSRIVAGQKIEVVSDRCAKLEHQSLSGSLHSELQK